MKTLATILALCHAVAGFAAEQAPWNLREHIPLEEVVVQSHRGAGVLMPENSIEAFELAWRLGTIPEADLRTSSDGVICAFHDGDFKRILPEADAAMRASGVGDHPWTDLAKLDIGAWKGPEHAGQRIPRMSEAYAILRKRPERRFYVDIKNVDLAQLAKESEGVHGQLILASTKYEQIRQWMRLAPDSATLHWMGGTEAELARRLADLEKVEFADVTQLQVHVRTDEAGVMSPSAEFLLKTGETLRKYGVLFQALAWEHDDAEIHWRLMDLGVASFATDYPDKVMEAIRDYYAAGEKAGLSASQEDE